MFKSKWSYLLLAIVILDSILTYYVFEFEGNPLILFVMNKWNLTLGAAMIIRCFYVLPLIFFLDRYFGKGNMWAMMLYLLTYFICVVGLG